MALRAVTSIQHFQDAEEPRQTQRVLIEADAEVPEDLFTEEELQELKDRGAVVEDSDLQKEQELKDQIAQLQAELERARVENEGLKARQPSPGTLFQTEAVTDEVVERRGENNDPKPSGVEVTDPGAAAPDQKVVKAQPKTDKSDK